MSSSNNFGVMLDCSGAIEKASLLLSSVPGGAERAVKAAITRTVDHLKANATREIRKEYAIAQANLRMYENVKTRTSNSGLTQEIIFSGSKLPLYRFSVSPKYPMYDKSKVISQIINGKAKAVHPGKPVKASIKKDSSGSVSSKAFIAAMESGHIGVFERTGEKTRKITERYALSIPQMLANEDVRNSLIATSNAKFVERVEHEITRILSS